MQSSNAIALPSGWPDAAGKRRLSELETDDALLRNHAKLLTRAEDILRSPINMTSLVQRRAALAYELSQDPKWGFVNARLHQKETARASVREPCEIETRHIQQWHDHWKHEACFQESLANKCHPDRIVVHEFLFQSLVYEFVEKQSARGLMVTSAVVIATYLQMWAYQEKTPAQTMRLEKYSDQPRRGGHGVKGSGNFGTWTGDTPQRA